MPAPTNLSDLSKTAASNYPAATDTLSTADDAVRALASIVAKIGDGTNALVSPSVTTSIVTGSTTFAIANTTATTLNIGGAATTVSIGAGAASTLNANFTTAINLNTAAIVSNQTTVAVINTNATTVNAFGAASTALNIGNAAVAAAFPGGISIADGKAVASGATATAFAGATTSLTIGGTGATSTVAIPGTLEATSATAASLKTAGGLGVAKAIIGGSTIKATTGIAVGAATPGAGGVAFPATAVAVADANTLDDYEEGTWTPECTAGFTGPTYSVQEGYYTKTGNQVTATATITLSGATSADATGVVVSLPFTAKNVTAVQQMGSIHAAVAASNATNIYIFANDNAATASVRIKQDTTTAAFLGNNLGTSGSLRFSITYLV